MNTVYALIAVAALAVLTLRTGAATRHAQTTTVGTEVSIQSLRAAEAALDRAAQLPFDAVSEPGSLAELTPASGFGRAGGPPADLDDLHGTTAAVADAAVPVALAARVRYVAWDGAAFGGSAVQTAFKEVCVEAREPDRHHATLCRTFALPT